jgi:hydrogenase expression/formation protein HypE
MGFSGHSIDPDDKSHKMNSLAVGKLPAELLAGLLKRAPILDNKVILGPGIGLDCAVIDLGASYLVAKSDPITFASDEIGWYLVHVNANDIATTGAIPRWLLATALLPEGVTTPAAIETIFEQVAAACRELQVSLVGGHTEITASVSQPVLVGTMFGEVEKGKLVTPRGARPGDRIILTKGVPIEATAIMAREFSAELINRCSPEELARAANYLHAPGISVLKDARVAQRSGRITAMHDPTEGGVATALWELAEASQNTLLVDPALISVPELSRRLCDILGLDPFGAIASGALLLTSPADDSSRICKSLLAEGIPASVIGTVQAGAPQVIVQADQSLFTRPARDEIARLFESKY